MTKEETNIQRNIMLELSKYGIVIRQQSGLFYTKYGERIKIGFPGISDLQFISDDGNLIAFIEIKTSKGKTSKEQEQFINFINNKKSKHLKAGVARNVEEALEIIGGKNVYNKK